LRQCVRNPLLEFRDTYIGAQGTCKYNISMQGNVLHQRYELILAPIALPVSLTLLLRRHQRLILQNLPALFHHIEPVHIQILQRVHGT
jgi:hypothetical protein